MQKHLTDGLLTPVSCSRLLERTIRRLQYPIIYVCGLTDQIEIFSDCTAHHQTVQRATMQTPYKYRICFRCVFYIATVNFIVYVSQFFKLTLKFDKHDSGNCIRTQATWTAHTVKPSFIFSHRRNKEGQFPVFTENRRNGKTNWLKPCVCTRNPLKLQFKNRFIAPNMNALRCLFYTETCCALREHTTCY
jgi:hypothetical protein